MAWFHKYQYIGVVDPLFPKLHWKALPIIRYEINFSNTKILGVEAGLGATNSRCAASIREALDLVDRGARGDLTVVGHHVVDELPDPGVCIGPVSAKSLDQEYDLVRDSEIALGDGEQKGRPSHSSRAWGTLGDRAGCVGSRIDAATGCVGDLSPHVQHHIARKGCRHGVDSREGDVPRVVVLGNHELELETRGRSVGVIVRDDGGPRKRARWRQSGDVLDHLG